VRSLFDGFGKGFGGACGCCLFLAAAFVFLPMAVLGGTCAWLMPSTSPPPPVTRPAPVALPPTPENTEKARAELRKQQREYEVMMKQEKQRERELREALKDR
jgi:hypothetical protein